ncbi:hypothetical protein GCM10009846_24890 [Agrococcus versicolor]|uniref:histidine kinase n=1 Tax=Agrococcus versicolor TaxID=501482 RepID=A0ABP5MQ19_9MICO
MPARPTRLAILGAVAALAIPGAIAIWRATASAWHPGAAWARELGVAPAGWTLAIGLAATVLGALAVLAADRWPRAGTLVAAVVTTAAWMLVFVPLPPATLPLAVVVVLAARAGRAGWAAAGIALFLGAGVTAVAVLEGTRGMLVATVMTSIALAAVLVVAVARRARREQARRAREQAEELARTRHAREREDMARELHDVLAHSLSSISVQAGVALHLADREPARATEALATIRDTSRQALDDVRHMLGVLRGEAEGPLVPEASLDALPALVEGAAGMGIHPALVDRLHPRPSTAIQSAIVRIVREALTNAARHAPGAHVAIDVERQPEGVTVRVVDDGAGARTPAQPTAPAGAGTGIVGMRERVALLGGTLEAGPTERGFAIVATFPEAS